MQNSYTLYIINSDYLHIDVTQSHCTAIIIYCKSPDEAILEPSLIL